ncbi:hypothetical protein Y1Q_0018339 [Alligator mississippiensis]|uniref:Uncharacterized protein n=1 Tax=Alligator mississippiensis TaxID=8496 RepID=A0A151PBY2_ALLMI|nr:hypothetical protein Y1Q_0018339 [Alligator mississippiensis]
MNLDPPELGSNDSTKSALTHLNGMPTNGTDSGSSFLPPLVLTDSLSGTSLSPRLLPLRVPFLRTFLPLGLTTRPFPVQVLPWSSKQPSSPQLAEGLPSQLTCPVEADRHLPPAQTSQGRPPGHLQVPSWRPGKTGQGRNPGFWSSHT